MHTLAFVIVFILLGRIWLAEVDGRPGPAGESDFNRFTLSRSIMLLLTKGFGIYCGNLKIFVLTLLGLSNIQKVF